MKVCFYLSLIILLLVSCRFDNTVNRPTKTLNEPSDSVFERKYTKFVIEDYESILEPKYAGSWDNHDTLWYTTLIDSLHTLDGDICIGACYTLSVETGFGYSLVDIDNLTWFDTLSLEKKERVLKMIIGGFRVYKNSNLFMKRLPYVISLHEHLVYDFQWGDKKRTKFFKELEIYCNRVAKCTDTWPDNTEPDSEWEPTLDC